MSVGTYISIITLNTNGLNAPTKRHRLAECIQKQDPYICCLQETLFRPKDTYRLKVRGWKNIVQANGKQKKAGVAILISDKIDLKIKKITRDKEGHYIMIKGSIQEEDITIVNIYAPNIGAPQYISAPLIRVLKKDGLHPPEEGCQLVLIHGNSSLSLSCILFSACLLCLTSISL